MTGGNSASMTITLASAASQGGVVVDLTSSAAAVSVQPFAGLEVIAKAGTVVATDGDTTWRTPYDDCVMVMPSMAQLKPCTTMVRLGRYG